MSLYLVTTTLFYLILTNDKTEICHYLKGSEAAIFAWQRLKITNYESGSHLAGSRYS
jgi:hypothetical protein